MAEKPGGSRKNMNQVEVNAQWEEAVKKENRGRILKEHFDFNPKNLNVITEKPTNLNRLNIMAKELKEPVDQDGDMQTLKTKLQTLTNIPKKKYPFPMTAAQEVGWEADNLFDTHKPKYAFNRQMYPETKYVSDYVTTMHVNPLIKQKAVPLEKK